MGFHLHCVAIAGDAKTGSRCGPGKDNTGAAYGPAQEMRQVPHLDLAFELTILEDSSVPFTGAVSFPAVQPYLISDRSPLPSGWVFPDKTPRPCPLGKATVCLYEYKTENKVVCDETASDGTYVIPAPLGMELYAQVSLGSHITFLRSKASTDKDAAAGRTAHTSTRKFKSAVASAPDASKASGSQTADEKSASEEGLPDDVEVFTIAVIITSASPSSACTLNPRTLFVEGGRVVLWHST